MAGSAEEALNAGAWAGCDLLLTDVGLPGMDGIALAGRVRAERPGFPVVVVSASGERGVADRARGRRGERVPLKGRPGQHARPHAPPRPREFPGRPGRGRPMNAPGTHRVVLVDDHAVLRWGLRQLFEAEPDFAVCAEAATADEGFRAAERLAPDLLVTDLTLEGRGGLELTGQLQRYHPDLPVLVVSMHDSALFASRALAAGARGYVMKGRADRDVIPAARAALAGRTFVEGAAGPAPTDAASASGGDPVAALSDRELEVFLLIGQGFAPRHIAQALCLSVSTIEAYRERIKEKLGLSSSPTLLRFAIRWCKGRTE